MEHIKSKKRAGALILAAVLLSSSAAVWADDIGSDSGSGVDLSDGQIVGTGSSTDADRNSDVTVVGSADSARDDIYVDESTDRSQENTSGGTSASTNSSYVDTRSDAQKEMDSNWYALRNKIASWRDYCTGDGQVYGSVLGNGYTTIKSGILPISEISAAKDYISSISSLRTKEADDSYYATDTWWSTGNTPSASVAGADASGYDAEMQDSIKNGIATEEGFSEDSALSFIGYTGLGAGNSDLSAMTGIMLPSITTGADASGYKVGSPIRTDMISGGLNYASDTTWYKAVEALYRYLDIEVPESTTGAHGTFRSNAMNDYCSISLITNYKVQDITEETEIIGDPISDDYQLHLFSEDDNGDLTEIAVLPTNTKATTIHLADYPGVTKLVARYYRRFNQTKYISVSYAVTEYLVDTETGNILWFSEESMESEAAGKSGCRTVTMDVETGISNWCEDPDEAVINITDISELTTDETKTQRIE